MNDEFDWAVIGRTHVRVLVYPRGHQSDVRELMPYPIWSIEACKTQTWLESLTAYAYEQGECNIEAFHATVVVLRPISEVIVIIHNDNAPDWCGWLMRFTQYVLQGVTTWSPTLNRHTLSNVGRVIRYSHNSELAQRLVGVLGTN